MKLVKRMAVGTAVAAAVLAPAIAANAQSRGAEPPAGQVMGRLVGPFSSMAECRRSEREYDIDYTIIMACTDPGGQGRYWFEYE
ncbi:hypothetical protein SAMN05444920_102116 [Nonomuraea solani]|uniref:Uncharacterized protein n=1 Tax=Nonomuraea solani TaxID=1144553 RepID=A0A1H5Y3D6_9ACTN|nr:hypothetical protein [Nonomuraea solani]SEG18295.1 hypothetical protein SAMN05444920_102116 [Nonomuraea solani]